MAHRSWCAEQPGEPSNERLEFLGDAVLGFVVADHVYRTYEGLSEGQLTDARKAVVNAAFLAEVAVELNVGAALLLGKGEDAAGGRHKPSILSDALEAVIGAVYLDGGIEAAYALVLRLMEGRVAEAVQGLRGLDFKTLLQEQAQRDLGAPVRYEIEEAGPDHAKEFSARAVVGDRVLGRGQGRSKKRAEQAAARAAWSLLSEEALRVEVANGADGDAGAGQGEPGQGTAAHAGTVAAVADDAAAGER